MDTVKNLVSNINSSKEILKNCYIPNITIPQQTLQQLSLTNDSFKTAVKEVCAFNKEKNKRELENNENIKAIVEHNQQISNYNKKLVSLNEKILNKINSLDDTLSFLNDTFKDKSKFDKEKQTEQTGLLLELIKIMDEKDSNSLKKFINNIGSPVAVGLMVEYLKMLVGISN